MHAFLDGPYTAVCADGSFMEIQNTPPKALDL